MSICQICRYQTTDDSTPVCPNCGASLGVKSAEYTDEGTEETYLSDDVTGPIPVTGSSVSDGKPADTYERIEVCPPGELIGSPDEPLIELATSGQFEGQPPDISPHSEPHPAVADNFSVPVEQTAENAPLQKIPPQQATQVRSELSPDTNTTLSPTEISEILYRANTPQTQTVTAAGTAVQATAAQALADLKKAVVPPLAGVGEAGQQLPESTVEVQHTPAVRRIAFFHKNRIELTGIQHPASGEELIIGDRYYLLKPKKIKQQYTAIAFAVGLALVLTIIAVQFILPTLPGNGSVVGIVLDDGGRPWASEIEVSLPEVGQKTKTDPSGFFRFDAVPTGTYKIRCSLPGGTVSSDNITVVGNDVATTILGVSKNSTMTNLPGQTASIASPATTNSERAGGSAVTAETAQGQASGIAYSAIRLKTNTENARLTVDGDVLGVGDLTYKKILSGKHRIAVSSEGYITWQGTVQLKPNETYALSVNLSQPAAAAQTQTYSADDFLKSGRTALSAGNLQSAIQDFTEAINLQPTMADALAGRAEAFRLSENRTAYEADLVKAAELYTSQNRFETAHGLYSEALATNRNSISALLGRAELYHRQNDRNSAMEDYKQVLKLEPQNLEANFELGKIYFAMGKNKDADKRFRQAREINPRMPEIYHYLMLNYLSRDDINKVKEVYADFKLNVTEDQVQSFKDNPRFDAVLRVVGEYQRP